MRFWIFFVIFLGTQCSIAADVLYPFDTPSQAHQFETILRDLRCLVCQNQDIMDSHAPFAVDLRAVVYEKVKQGEQTETIIDFLTARYGDFILFNPPMKSLTAALWVLPFIFLIIGLWMFKRVVRCES